VKETAPAPSKPADQGFEPSLEVAQLCLLSGERLIADAEDASIPTAIGLLELGIEELAKGWMVYFECVRRLGLSMQTEIKEGRPASLRGAKGRMWALAALTRENLTRAQHKAVSDFFEKNEPLLANLPLVDAFKRHEVKLDFLSFLVRYLRMWIPIAVAADLGSKNAAFSFGPPFKGASRADGPTLKEVTDLLESLDEDRLRMLKNVKESALYVNLTQDDTVAYPLGSEAILQTLEGLAELIHALLETELRILLPLRE
jgi:hypothetical protein